jgi:DNA-binding beta-propeller fold protein YncE
VSVRRHRWIGALLGCLASVGHAQVHDADGTNHYILQCGDCMPATEKAIGLPSGIAVDASGNVVFASQNVVFALRRDGTLVRVAGTGVPGSTGDGGPAVDARLAIPVTYHEPIWDEDWMLYAGVAFDRDGNLYIADTANHRIRVVGTDGAIRSLGDVDGAPFEFSWPGGIAVDRGGALFVGSVGSGRVARRSVEGDVQDLWVPDCLLPWYSPCSTRQVSVDATGAVLFGDGNCRVFRWTGADPSSRRWRDRLVTVAGIDSDRPYYDCEPGYSGDGGPALQARFGSTQGVAADRFNRMIIAQTFHDCVRRVDESGFVDTIAGRCDEAIDYPGSDSWPPGPMDPSLLGDGGPAREARLNHPSGVAADADGNIYIADTGNRRIRRIGPDGIIRTVAGNGEPLP